MDRKYFKDYYILERNHWWFLARAKIIKMIIDRFSISKNKEQIKILNIGVATFKTSQMLKNFGVVTSVEYDNECCKFIRDELGEEVINGSITNLPFSANEFDLVCAFDVIEHVEDDKKGVEEMLRVCRNEGNVFITVPAFKFLWSEHDIINHHYRRYTKKEVLGLFDAPQWKVIKSSYFNFLLFLPISAIRIFKKVLPKKTSPESDFTSFKPGIVNTIFHNIFLIEKSLLRIFKLPFGVSVLLLAEKNSDF